MTNTSLPPALPFDPPPPPKPASREAPRRSVPDTTNFTPLEVCKYLTDPSRKDRHIFRSDSSTNTRSSHRLLAYWTGTHFRTLPRDKSTEFFADIMRDLSKRALVGEVEGMGELSDSGKRKAKLLANTTESTLRAFKSYADTAISLAKPAPTPIERTAYMPQADTDPDQDPFTRYVDLSDLPTDLILYSTILPYLTDPLDTLTPKHIHTTREAALQLQDNLPAFFITPVPESLVIRSERELPNIIAAPFATYRIITAPLSETCRRYATDPSPFVQAFLDSKGFNATVSKKHTQQERYTPHSLILTYNA